MFDTTRLKVVKMYVQVASKLGYISTKYTWKNNTKKINEKIGKNKIRKLRENVRKKVLKQVQLLQKE